MAIISREDVQKAFQGGKMKRCRLLYDYYRTEYFIQDYTAAFIADKISADLGFPITEGMIKQIRFRIAKKDFTPLPSPTSSLAEQPKGKEDVALKKTLKQEKEWVFTNQDDEPKKNPFEDLFKGR